MSNSSGMSGIMVNGSFTELSVDEVNKILENRTQHQATQTKISGIIDNITGVLRVIDQVQESLPPQYDLSRQFGSLVFENGLVWNLGDDYKFVVCNANLFHKTFREKFALSASNKAEYLKIIEGGGFRIFNPKNGLFNLENGSFVDIGSVVFTDEDFTGCGWVLVNGMWIAPNNKKTSC